MRFLLLLVACGEDVNNLQMTPDLSALVTVVSTRVFSKTASGWKTAKKRRTAMS